jgi:hypothetical protein
MIRNKVREQLKGGKKQGAKMGGGFGRQRGQEE